jgi:hypothetical protein
MASETDDANESRERKSETNNSAENVKGNSEHAVADQADDTTEKDGSCSKDDANEADAIEEAKKLSAVNMAMVLYCSVRHFYLLLLVSTCISLFHLG